MSKEIVVEVNADGYWIFPSQKKKGKGYSPTTPAYALARLIAIHLKRKQVSRLKIVALDEEE